jgi:glycosyltransferase involved in cell wall biosynthesis
VITARGSDVNLIARFALQRAMIRSAAHSVAGVITVSNALKDVLVQRGVRSGHIRVLRNGVDLAMFRPLERAQARRELGFQGPTLLSVGNLVKLKGHRLMIEALARLPGYRLAIAGEGPERATLEALALRTGVAERVRFLGKFPHERLASAYSAADALVLASSREGWPNVLLEAMACGTPVVVSNIPGIAEIVTDAVGAFMPERTPMGVAAAVVRLFTAPPDRGEVRRYAERFSWDETSKGQIRLLSEILAAGNPACLHRDSTSANDTLQ